MEQISLLSRNNPLGKRETSDFIASWELASCKVTLAGEQALRGIVEYPETGLSHTIEVKSPFTSASQVPSTVKKDFYVKIASSKGIPTCLELCVRGIGGGKFYNQPAVPFAPLFEKASLNRDPKTPQELVSVLKQIPAGDPRVARYLGFASQFIKTFSTNPTLMKDQIDGLVILVLSENQDITHSVINELTSRIRNNTLLNLDLVHGLADAIDRANPSHLNADDLVQIMFTIVERIAKTHGKGAEKSQEEQLKALIRVLNAMVDANVCDLSREKQEDIKKLLGKFSDSDSSGVQCLAVYAKEALTRVPNDETKLAAFFRVSVGLAKGVYYFYAAVNQIDPGKLVDGFFALQESAQGIYNFAMQIKEGFVNALPDAKESLAALKEGTASLKVRKLTYYDQIRYVEMLIASNSFQALEAFLFNPRLQKDPVFFYALVDKLNQVMISTPNLNVRTETLRLLQNLYQDDKTWNKLTFKEDHFKNEGPSTFDLSNRDAIRRWMSIKGKIVSQLVSYQQFPELQSTTTEILGVLTQGVKGEERAFISRHKESAPKISSPTTIHTPLFAPKAKDQFAFEAKIERAKASLVEDSGFIQERPLYVPLMGSSQAGSPVHFDLIEEVLKFLRNDQKVLLILGPAGNGKTFFSQVLSETLWNRYQPDTGTIPILVSLPSVHNASWDLLSETFKRMGFTQQEVIELKSREVVFILDGYDELPPDTQLFKQNAFLEFKGKIIITCRTEALPSSDLFVPIVNGKPKRSLLKEIHLVPFNASQIDHFIQKCIDLGNTEWKTTSQYREQIDKIPGLRELVQNPFILKIITDTLPEIVDRHKQIVSNDRLSITRYALYEAFADEWFQKGYTRAVFSELRSLGLNAKNLKSEAFSFCVQFANALATHGLTHVRFSNESADPTWDSLLGENPKAAYLRSMIPLKVTSDGYYSFLHKSIFEYFLAQGSKMIIIQKERHSVKKDVPLFNALLEPSVWLFLADAAKDDATLKRGLWDLIELSKSDPQMAIAGANAASIWNLANFSFSRKDLRGARLPGSYLERANLMGADLRNSDLRGANLTTAILIKAMTDGAKMDGVRFGQWPSIKLDSYGNDLVFSKNGDQLFVAGEYCISVWDVESGKRIRSMQIPNKKISHLTLLDGGNKLTWLDEAEDKWGESQEVDRTLIIYDLERLTIHTRLTGHTKRIEALAVREDGKVIATGGRDATIRVWDVVSGDLLQTLHGWANHLAFLDGGNGLASNAPNEWDSEQSTLQEDIICIWDLRSGEHIASLPVPKVWVTPIDERELTAELENSNKEDIGTDEVGMDLNGKLEAKQESVKPENEGAVLQSAKIRHMVSINNGKRLLLNCWASGSIFFWDTSLKGEIAKLYSPKDEREILLGRMVALKGTDKFASDSGRGHIEILDSNTGECSKILNGDGDFSVAEDGNKLISYSRSDLRIWNIDNSTLQLKVKDLDVEDKFLVVNGLLYTVSGNTITVKSLITQQIIKEIHIEGEDNRSYGDRNHLVLLDEGKKIAIGCDCFVAIWDLESGVNIKKLEGHKKPLKGLILLDKTRLVSIGEDEVLVIWDTDSWRQVNKYQLTVNYGNTFLWKLLPVDSGRKIALDTCDGVGEVNIWDIRSGQLVMELIGEGAVTFDAGRKVALHNAGYIDIWNVPLAKRILRLKDDGNILRLIQGEKKLVSGGGADKTIRIWDPSSGTLLNVLNGHTEYIFDLVCLGEGRFASKEGGIAAEAEMIRFWDSNRKQQVCEIPVSGVDTLYFQAPDLLFASSRREQWCWKLNFAEQDFKPELLWANNSDLMCSQMLLGNSSGLSEPNRRLLVQHGAIAEKS